VHLTAAAVSLLIAAPSIAQSHGTVATGIIRGVVHDVQHRPIQGAQVRVRAENSVLVNTLQSDANGEFELRNLPPGRYAIEASANGFAALELAVTVKAGRNPVLHLQLEVGEVVQSVTVSAALGRLNTQSSTVETIVTPQQIARTPGADQTNSLAMITDYVPGTTIAHDMLHIRGGHQVSWFFDGIPVINTNIAANVAPLINPKNVDSLEVERGGFSSEYGDRTYGFFNVVTPSGFERNRQAELVTSYGNFRSTDNQINFGSHTERFAYYASVDGNRSDLGLATPTPEVIHDQSAGVGGFLSILYNPTPQDQLRWIASLRQDHYQIPNTPADQAAGIRDVDEERDALLGFQWAHTASGGVLFSLSPYFHLNDARYLGGPGDEPYVLEDHSRAAYLGTRAVLAVKKQQHDARFGAEIWGQHEVARFGLTANPGGQVVQQQQRHWANSDAVFAEDQYRPVPWLTLNAGMRFTHYGGLVSENAVDPRLGVGVRLPRLNWTLRGSYSYYFQPPPLDSVSGPLLEFAAEQGFGFVPLPAERDIQSDFGLTIPVHGWAVDVDYFHTNARDYLDHDVIGNSGIFIPLSLAAARVRGTEATLRSPEIFGRAQLRVAYSNQLAQGLGPIVGGLLSFDETETSYFLLDHDQRNTASAVLSVRLPRRAWITPAVNFGSGFVDGDGPAHLPPHTTADLALGKSLGENWSVSINAINLANHRFLLDNSNTFGGTHYVNPRQVYAEVRYRFHF
jgi:outer membrane receptor for ferrienterochelin and colicin